MLKRPELPNEGQTIEHYFNPRDYKKVSPNFAYIRQLCFQVKDEKGERFEGFQKMRLRLHFISK